MSQPIKIIAKIVAVLCAIGFAVTAFAALLLFNLERRAFNPNIYKDALASRNFYQRLPSLLGPELAKAAMGSNIPIAKQFTSDDWAAIIRTLLPPEQLEIMTEDAITQIFAYLNDETSHPHISLTPLKQRLSGPAGMEMAVNLIHAQPDCSIEQLVQMAASFGQVLCNPPQSLLNIAKPAIQAQLNLIAANIPDQMSFIDTSTPTQKAGNLRNIRLAMQFSPLAPLVFLFLNTLFAVRTFKDWMTWWGWPLLWSGIMGALAGFSGAPVFRMALENYISTRTQLSIPAEFTPAIRTVADEVLRQILQPAGWQGLILAGTGLSMLLISLIISNVERNRRHQRSEAKTQIGL